MAKVIENGLVSVIIPCYQHAEVVSDAIDSVLAQTYSPIEIILINDGSTDHTRDVIASYLKQYGDRFHYIEQENQGQAKSRRIGASVARGEFWVTLDADDLLEPNMIAQCVNVLQADPEAVAVASDVSILDPSGKNVLFVMKQDKTPQWTDILTHNVFGGIAGIMLRATAIAQIGGLGVEGKPGAEDWDLWIRIARAKMKVAYIPQALGRYRQSPRSHSRTQALEVLEAKLTMLETVKTVDPRLSAIPDPYPPISEELYSKLRNQFVFFSLGLLAASEASEKPLKAILAYLSPLTCEVSVWVNHFFRGVMFYNLPLKRTETEFDDDIIDKLENYGQIQQLFTQSQWQSFITTLKTERKRRQPSRFDPLKQKIKGIYRGFSRKS